MCAANYSSGTSTNDNCTTPPASRTTTSTSFRRTPLNSSNVLNPQAPVFVPNFYKQDFNSNNPPKSYADVVNADRDPLDMSDEKEELEYHQAMMEEDSTTL